MLFSRIESALQFKTVSIHTSPGAAWTRRSRCFTLRASLPTCLRLGTRPGPRSAGDWQCRPGSRSVIPPPSTPPADGSTPMNGSVRCGLCQGRTREGKGCRRCWAGGWPACVGNRAAPGQTGTGQPGCVGGGGCWAGGGAAPAPPGNQEPASLGNPCRPGRRWTWRPEPASLPTATLPSHGTRLPAAPHEDADALRGQPCAHSPAELPRQCHQQPHRDILRQ